MRMKKIRIIYMALCMSTVLFTGCRNDVYSSENTAIEEENRDNTGKVRQETDEEIANRAKQQAEIAKVKAEIQRDSSELIINEGIGEVGVASSTRPETSIPTYVYFPAEFNVENTYPLVIMLAGFSAAHDNGTRFDMITSELNKKGIMVVQYDYPGYGKSAETNLAYTLTNVKNDAADVLRYIKNNYNVSKVGAFGYDFGGRAIMEMQVEGIYDFDQIELIAPFSETEDFVHACFEEENWAALKAQAKDAGLAKFGEQEYAYQWFADWENRADSLTDDFISAYKKRRIMIIYSILDDWVDPMAMEKLYKGVSAAAIAITDVGHDLGVRGYSTPEQTERVIRQQSAEFMSDLLR